MFRYMLIDEAGCVSGTNSLELATKCSACDQFLVLDCETRILLSGDAINETKVKLEHFAPA